MATKKISYQEAVSEIEEILAKIENEEFDLDELAEKVTRVTMLIRMCREKLYATQEEVEKILGEMDNHTPKP